MEHFDPPPPYSPYDRDTAGPGREAGQPYCDSSNSEFHTPVQSGQALTAESPLRRPLQIPSKSSHFTSGFAYVPVLSRYGVSERHWNQFTKGIIHEAKLSNRQWTTTVAKGLGVLAVGGPMFGFMSIIPAVLVGLKARRNREKENLAIATSDSGSNLSRMISSWNETFFEPRGILIRLDLPESGLVDLIDMDIASGQTSSGRLPRDTSRAYSLRPTMPPVQAEKKEASSRARIVIIPLSTRVIHSEPFGGRTQHNASNTGGKSR